MTVFKAYDIRGIAGKELDAEFSERLGKAIATHLDAKCISLGTTSDFEDAIIEGSTHIRVGTAIFGQR